MRKSEIELGQTYLVKVSGKLAPVQIHHESSLGGWAAVNLRTKRAIRIRSGLRIRHKLTKCGICKKVWILAIKEPKVCKRCQTQLER